METKVPEEVLLYDVLTPVVQEHKEGLGHLTVTHKSVMLHVMIPHLHEVLLPFIDICEVIDHLAGLDFEPLRVCLVLVIATVKNSMRGDGQARCTIMIQSVMPTHKRSLVLIGAAKLVMLKFKEL